MASHRSRVGIPCWVLGVALVSACGGNFSRGAGAAGDDSSSGSAGTAVGAAGAAAGSAGAPVDSGGQTGSAGEASGSAGAPVGSAGAPAGCAQDGVSYPDGASFSASDGCNTCVCKGGQPVCTERACPKPCQQVNRFYNSGETFTAIDGCNTCTCQSDGSVSCTALDCVALCQALRSQFQAAATLAKSCEPGVPSQCTQPFAGDCCGPEFANPAQADALTAATAAAKRLSMLCAANIECVACHASTTAYCSPAGQCERVYVASAAAGCLVGDVIYPSGASGIPDPRSCNFCACDDGNLNCDNAICPSSCPAGTSYASRCTQCGPHGGCGLVEFGCFPPCNQDCPDGGSCLEGVCEKVCG